ncbi:unnamed protein product, partial [Vitis vinifera]|uniref:SNF2 N-terminal domain-containing protein n=1 Tax=Vitis vinifera TaxID=29760 RepID=D7T0L4_VITVI
MGLGKTIQVLSFLGALHFSNMYKPSVVICPVILLRQWKREVKKMVPKFSLLPVFEAKFAVPISVGGYANASPLQVSTTYSLTAKQRSVYRAFLASSEVEQIFDGSRNSLYAINVMHKIYNHLDLLEQEHAYQNPDYGNFEHSGKWRIDFLLAMQVVILKSQSWVGMPLLMKLYTQTQ